MNDIPRGSSHGKLARFLLAQSHGPSGALPELVPQVVFGSNISDSRLDDELSVATLEFTDTPPWLLNQHPSGFPKHTLLGTIWLGVDRQAIDNHGRTEFIRAVINKKGHLDLLYAEMLAEFADTDVNIQDEQGRTALHWACALARPEMINLCLSVPNCDSGLRDSDNFTAFDLARRTGDDSLPGLFYRNMFEIEQSSPQVALLRILTLSSDRTDEANKPAFPGEALFQPVGDRNTPLVAALLDRGIDLTTKDQDGNTALHVAASQADNADMVTRLLVAGSDINAVGNSGSTPLHSAVRTADVEMVQVLLHWKADLALKDEDGLSALHLAGQDGTLDIERVLLQEGADVGEQDNCGQTAVDVAQANHPIQFGEVLSTGNELGDSAIPDPPKAPEGVPVEQSDRVNPNSRSIYLLHYSSEHGHTMVVKELLTSGALIDATDRDTDTPLRGHSWAYRDSDETPDRWSKIRDKK